MCYCLCPTEKDEFNTKCAALRSGREVTMACGDGMKVSGECTGNQCPAGYTGSFERRCNGNGEWEEIENNCVRITCPEESFEGVMWRATEGGATAVHSCGVV